MSNLPSSHKARSLRRDIKTALEFVRQNRWWMVAGPVAGVLLAVGYLARSPRVYEATAVIQVEQQEPNVTKIEAVRNEDLKTVEILKTFEQTVVSPTVLSRVLKDPELRAQPSFLPPAIAGGSLLAQEQALEQMVSARIRRGTRLIDITVQHSNPAVAKRISDLIVREFIQWNYESRREAGKTANLFLVKEAERLRGRLLDSEQALQRYKQENNSVSLEDRQNIMTEKLRSLNQRVTEANAERLRLEADRAQLRNISGATPEALLGNYALANAPGIQELRRSIAEHEAIVANLAKRYKPAHPKYAEAQGELDKLRGDLTARLRSAAETVESKYTAALVNEQKLEVALRDQERIALELNAIYIPYAALVRDVESDRAIYQSVLARLKETDITKDIGQDAVRLVSSAMTPEIPVRPNKKRTLMLGILGGGIVGLGIAALGQMLDGSLKSAEEVELRLGVPLLASIPACKLTPNRFGNIPVVNHPASEGAEAFRGLRTALSLGDGASERKVFLFTSVQPGEGKSFCALNTAVSFAQQGMKTLVVDADLRRPSIEKMLSLDAPRPGLCEVLGGEVESSVAIVSGGIEGLSVLGAGKNPARPVERLAGDSLGRLLETLGSKFDRVVINGAPMHWVSDSLLIARHVQMVCLVACVGRTTFESVQQGLQRFKVAGVHVGGIVLNRARSMANVGGKDYSAGYPASGSEGEPSNIMRLPGVAVANRNRTGKGRVDLER